jgi:hypothetical protein
MKGDEPFLMILAGALTALGWFFGGMNAAPRSQETKNILFALTVILLVGIGVNFSPIVLHFSAHNAFSGKYNGSIFAFTGFISATTWIWFSGGARRKLTLTHKEGLIKAMTDNESHKLID